MAGLIPDEILVLLDPEEKEKLQEYIGKLGRAMLEQETSPWGISICFNFNQLGTRIFATSKDVEPNENVMVIRED